MGRGAGGEQGGAQVDVELADDHLHHVERGLVGDPPAGHDVGLLAERQLQRGGLGAAAVEHHDPVAARGQRGDVGRDHGQLPAGEDVAADLDDQQAHGQLPGSSSESRSSRPSTRFMFWIAWPAPPLIRLSRHENTVSVRVSPAGSPSANPTST